FRLLVAFLAGVFGGLVPAVQSARLDLNAALKEGGRSASSPHKIARSVLTAGQIALALVMLIGSGLAIRSLVRLLGVRAGFAAEQALTLRLPLPDSTHPTAEQVAPFPQHLLERPRALPGVEAAAGASELPLRGGNNGVVYIEGQPRPKNMWSSPLVEWCRVTPDFFRTLHIPLLQGRDFTSRDTQKQPNVAVINE